MRKRLVMAGLLCFSMFLSYIPTAQAFEREENDQSNGGECFESVELDNVSAAHLEELGLDDLDISSITVQSVEAECIDQQARNRSISTEDVGALIVQSFDADSDLVETTCTIVYDENGEVMSAARLTEYMDTTDVGRAEYAQVQGRYKIYTDGFADVYVNPYEVTIVQRKEGCEYIGGRLSFHGRQVYTSNFQYVPGIDCCDAYKFWAESSPITTGKEYKNTGYFYTNGRALRMQSCGIHGSSGSQLYLEYKINGKTYKYPFLIHS